MAQLPDGFESLRPHQEQALTEIIDLFTDGQTRTVFLDAPTGSGKTLIGHQAGRELAEMEGQEITTLYVCNNKDLQDQFMQDFPHAKLLRGRANYPTQSNPNATAADCTRTGPVDPCLHCEDGREGCPYEIAKAEALNADLACINTAYLLYEGNYVGGFSGRDLVIVDEADTLEDILMGFVEYRVPDDLRKEVGMTSPKKGTRKPTIADWLDEFAENLKDLPVNRKTDPKRYARIRSAIQNAERVAKEMRKDADRQKEMTAAKKAIASGAMTPDEAEDLSGGLWVRDYEWKKDGEDIGLVLKPVTVSNHGARNLWKLGKRWLLMSATLISSDEMADSLGLPFDYETVTVPMTFPPENRPITIVPIANPVFREMEDAIKKLAYAIQVVAEKHPGERILVHTVSYKLANELSRAAKGQSHRREFYIPARSIITYEDGRNRERALRNFREDPGAIMFAPSMSRGVDLKDDDCRVQVIAKVPFPYLGDAQVSARMHMPGGQLWYTVSTIRDIVQMTGRAVRHEDDWATTYIFDQQFNRNIFNRSKRLFPEWWREGIVRPKDVREFLYRG